ncbi:protein DEK [Procambarus clarkii]|uniref:protein DEK n=1 Tax=Procambarus clarkii TaxID=6728 RepID=UPI0037429AD0
MSDDETKQPVEETTDGEKKKDEEVKEKEEEEGEEERQEPKTKDKEDKLDEKEEEETKEEKANEEESMKEEEDNEEEEEEDEEEDEVERKPQKEEVTTTPKKEKDSEVPLYDQPLEMSGKRDRKKVERFVQEAKKEEVEPTGAGVPLGDIPFIDAMITKMQADELKVLHRVAYSRPGSGTEIKKNLRKFNGFPFTKDDKKYQSKLSTVERIIMSELKKILMILGLERSGIKGEIVERLMAFMLDPQDTGKRPPKSVKKGKGPRGRPRKGHDKKRENNTSVNDSGSGGSESGESDSEEQEEEDEEPEEEEEEEKPKKAPRKTPAKKAPAKRAASAKKATPARRSRAAESDDSDSDDEPLAKKVKQPPSDAELKIMVKKILEGANLEEVTMKSVCRQVYDNYPDFDLTHKKVFIKETVKSIIS